MSLDLLDLFDHLVRADTADSATPDDAEIARHYIHSQWEWSMDLNTIPDHVSAYDTPLDDPTVIGDPYHDAFLYHAQTHPDTCAVVAQQGILQSFGIDLTETDLTRIARQFGWYEPGNGTTMQDVGQLLEAFGIGVHHVTGGSVSDIIRELEQGHKVIAGVDANEMWSPESSLSLFHWWHVDLLPDANHAVWITGIDLDKHIVYMNDSGVPDGQARAVDLDDFLDAWNDSGRFYCATDTAPPA